jgi:hypothetical protein
VHSTQTFTASIVNPHLLHHVLCLLLLQLMQVLRQLLIHAAGADHHQPSSSTAQQAHHALHHKRGAVAVLANAGLTCTVLGHGLGVEVACGSSSRCDGVGAQ